VKKFIFFHRATYGEPEIVPIPETIPKRPSILRQIQLVFEGILDRVYSPALE